MRYSYLAAAQSAAGISVPKITTVLNNLLLSSVCVYPIMVAQAGASQEAPGTVVTGNANLVWATTLEVSVSGGSCYTNTTEAESWLITFLLSVGKITRSCLGDVMFYYNPLSAEEIIDHSRALASAILDIENPIVKELLLFILLEKLDLLSKTLEMPAADE